MHLPLVAYACLGLLLLGMTSFNAFALQSQRGGLIGYNESTVTVVDKQSLGAVAACGNDDVRGKSLLVRDQTGNAVKQTPAGSQVALQVTYENKCVDSQPSIVILEVRDPSGITNYLAWQNVTMDSGGQATVESSWVAPEKTGYYEVRAFSFALLSLQSSGVLHPVLTYRLEVLPSGFE